MAFRRALEDAELWVGEMRQVRIEGWRVLLLRTPDGVFAYEDRCPHLGVPLSRGRLEGAKLTCSAHQFQYDAKTGAGINPASVCLKPFAVRVEAGSIWVDIGSGAPRSVCEIRPAEASLEVGPVLHASELGRAVLRAIVESNEDVRVLDRGAYYRVLARGTCSMARSVVERLTGAEFCLPSDLERVMPSFQGRLYVEPDRVEWRV